MASPLVPDLSVYPYMLQQLNVCSLSLLLIMYLQATYEGIPLVTSQGLVTLPHDIPDGSEIH
jgi:hypothetical protein